MLRVYTRVTGTGVQVYRCTHVSLVQGAPVYPGLVSGLVARPAPGARHEAILLT